MARSSVASAPTTSEPDSIEVSSWSLARKLAWVMDQAGYVQKRGWNDFHKYHYVTEGDLVSTIRPLLAKIGVIIIPSVVEEVRYPDAIQERNGMSSLTSVTVQYTVTDGKETITFRMPGHGADKGDKGVYKAITGSMKYALMKLFMVETGDDPERDNPGVAEAPDVTITASNEEGVEKGGHTKTASRYQLQRISATMREKGIDRTHLLTLINEVLGVELELPEEEDARSKTILLFLQELSSEDAGLIVKALDEWKDVDGAA